MKFEEWGCKTDYSKGLIFDNDDNYPFHSQSVYFDRKKLNKKSGDQKMNSQNVKKILKKFLIK